MSLLETPLTKQFDAKKFDGQKFRDRMRQIKEKFLASMLAKRASLQVSNTTSSTDNTYKHSLTRPATLTTTETTETTPTTATATTSLQKDSKLNPSPSTAASSSSNQSSQVLNLLASQGPQVISILRSSLAERK